MTFTDYTHLYFNCYSSWLFCGWKLKKLWLIGACPVYTVWADSHGLVYTLSIPLDTDDYISHHTVFPISYQDYHLSLNSVRKLLHEIVWFYPEEDQDILLLKRLDGVAEE